MFEHKKGKKLHVEFDAVVNHVYAEGGCDIIPDEVGGLVYLTSRHLDAFATPIVEEPTGKWAVVRDQYGSLWLRRYVPDDCGTWFKAGTVLIARWSDIEGPTVLFEGVEE